MHCTGALFDVRTEKRELLAQLNPDWRDCVHGLGLLPTFLTSSSSRLLPGQTIPSVFLSIVVWLHPLAPVCRLSRVRERPFPGPHNRLRAFGSAGSPSERDKQRFNHSTTSDRFRGSPPFPFTMGTVVFHFVFFPRRNSKFRSAFWGNPLCRLPDGTG